MHQFKSLCLHHLFERQVELSPNLPALAFEGEQLTYLELNQRCNQVAHYIQHLGVCPDTPVGICLERSPELIISMLAVFKAGGACVYLDPGEPRERLTSMIEDSQVSTILLQQHLLETVPLDGRRAVCVDSNIEALHGQSIENPFSDVSANNLAYILFTSGSTGKPKGVLCPHLMCSISLLEELDNVNFTHTDRHLFKYPSSHRELFLPLISGGVLVVARPERHKDITYLLNLIAEQKVTVASFVPSMLQVLIGSDEFGPALPLRIIGAGGERFPADLKEHVLTALNVDLYDNYSLSEAFYVIPTKCELGTNHRLHERRYPGSMQAYVLDEALRKVSIDTPGELYISGDSLARGYLNRPELTAEKFIPNCYADKPGTRLYRTGDLARYRRDGTIELLDRIDNQVKIRGYRIELGEIEATLRQHPAVREAVEAESGDKRLLVYLVAGQKPSPSTSELRSFLKRKLPEYMVPSAFVVLDELPRTPTGKTDRRALLAIDSTGKSEIGFVAPRNELERTLAQMWEEILDVRPVGVKDNFWDLGGHSLLAIRLLGQIRKTFNSDFPISTLFQAPTIEHLANTLRQQKELNPLSSFVPLQPYGSKPPFFAAGRNARYTNLARYLGDDQPSYRLDVYALEEQCFATGRDPYTQVELMAAHFIEKIRVVQPEGPYFLGGGCEGGYLVYEIAQQLHRQGQQVAMLILWEVPPSFDRKKPFYPFFYLGHQIRSVFRHGPKKFVTKLLKKTMGANRPHSLTIEERQLQRIQMSVWQVLQNYVPQVYPGRIILFRAHEQQPGMYDPTVGWDELVTGGIEIHVLPGNHSTYFDEHFIDFAERLKACLDKAQKVDSGQRTSLFQ
jgi:amino acid adenylation domain-containing protein